MYTQYPYQEIKCLWCLIPMKRLFGKDSKLWSWKVSTYFDHDKWPEIRIFHSFSQCINFCFIDDHCQYWLNKVDGTLKSPNHGKNALGNYQNYNHNLNCTWIINADQGLYITLEIDYFRVNNNDTNDIYFYNFSNKVHHFSLVGVTIYQSMMDQISNHHQYQNWIGIPIIIQ